MPRRLGVLCAAAIAFVACQILVSTPASAQVGPGEYIVTGTGPGGGPHVKLWNADGSFADVQFQAYGEAFRGGVDVAMGDLDDDGVDEIITGPGAGGGPHVKVYDIDGNELFGFMAYDLGMGAGVNVGVADVDDDLELEIVTGPGPGVPPHVKAFSVDLDTDTTTTNASFMAGPTTSRGGADVTGFWRNPTDERQHLAVADGPNGPGQVRIYDALDSFLLAGSFAPYPGFGGGARINAVDIDFDDRDELVTGAGAGGGPHVKTFNSGPGVLGTLISPMSFFAYGAGFTGGVDVGSFVAGETAVGDSILTAAGPGGGPHVKGFNPPDADEGTSFLAYPGFTGGVRVDGGFSAP